MVILTKAGGLNYENEPDTSISINADEINQIVPAYEESVGNSVVEYNNGQTVNIVETVEEANNIINSTK